MGTTDRYIVPAAFTLTLLTVMAFTTTWISRPIQVVKLRVVLGPARLAPQRRYTLTFTPRDVLSGHIVTRVVSEDRDCIDITVLNRSLTYLTQDRACRHNSGMYTLPYRFPRYDDYVIFVDLQPQHGPAEAHRLEVVLQQCPLRRQRVATCAPAPARLVAETSRSYYSHGLTVVLGAPTHAILAGDTGEIAFIFLHRGRTTRDVQPADDGARDAVAVTIDAQHFLRLRSAGGTVKGGYYANGAAAFQGVFTQPGTYRVYASFKYRGHRIRGGFTIDVSPRPSPTPIT